MIDEISSFLWGYPLLAVLMGGGLFLSAKLRFPQLHVIGIFSEDPYRLSLKTKAVIREFHSFRAFQLPLPQLLAQVRWWASVLPLP